MACRSSVWLIMHTHKMDSPKGISYDMICAADLKVPSKLYLLLDAQPAMMMPTTSSEMMAIRKKRPDDTVDPDQSGASGRKAKPANTAAKMIRGAILNNQVSAFAGT